jgi:hypothetical protein
MDEWDPIGVRGVPEAADEYDSYLPRLVSRLREGKTADEIAAYLTWVEEEYMGKGRSRTARERNRALAARLWTWYSDAMSAPEG